MAELGILFGVDGGLDAHERVGAFQNRLHLERVELVHGVDLLGVFVGLDDEAFSLFVCDGVLDTTELDGDLVGPAALDLLEDAGDGDGA